MCFVLLEVQVVLVDSEGDIETRVGSSLKGQTVFIGHPSWSHHRKHQLFMLLKPPEHFWNRGALAAVSNWHKET